MSKENIKSNTKNNTSTKFKKKFSNTEEIVVSYPVLNPKTNTSENKYIMTKNINKLEFYLYEIKKDKYVLMGKGNSPIKLEEKFKIFNKKLK